MKFKSPQARVYCPSLDQPVGRVKNPRADLESCWVAGFLHHEEREQQKKVSRLKKKVLLQSGVGIPVGNTSTQKTRQSQYKTEENRREKYACSAEDERRLVQVQKRLGTGLTGAAKRQSPYLPMKKNSLKSKRSIMKKCTMRSSQLEAYFQTNRTEMEASIVIQCSWRGLVASRQLHELVQRRMAAISIQKTIRGFIARCWIKQWKRKRDRYVLRCQARFRQIITARRWRETVRIECLNAILIQKIVRSFLAKSHFYKLLCARAAVVIQIAYRSSIRRKYYRRKKRDVCATAIQRIARGRLSFKLHRELSIEMNKASLSIQKCWRGQLARQLRNNILRERYIQLLKRQIRIITVEVDHYESQLNKLVNSWNKEESALANDKEVLEKKLKETRSNIAISEDNTAELLKSKAQMTPEKIREGWEEEIDKSLIHERNVQTKMKLNATLYLQIELADIERRRSFNEEKRGLLDNKISQLKRKRSFIREKLRNDERARIEFESITRARKAAADEKRLWKVDRRSQSGKPKKDHLRHGTAESLQFCGGTVDLFAKEYDNGAVERVMKMIELQSYNSQVRELSKSFSKGQKLQKNNMTRGPIHLKHETGAKRSTDRT